MKIDDDPNSDIVAIVSRLSPRDTVVSNQQSHSTEKNTGEIPGVGEIPGL